MHYLKLIKAHLYYLLNKKNIIILIILNLISFIYVFVSSGLFNGYDMLDANRKYYYDIYNENTFIYFKIFYILFICFVSIAFFSGAYSKYSALIIKDKKSRLDFYVTKYVTLAVVNLCELIYLYLIYSLVLLLTPYFKDVLYYFNFFVLLYLVGLYYMFLCTSLLILSKTYLSGLVVIVLFWISVGISESFEVNTLTTICLSVLPNIIIINGLYSVPQGNFYLFIIVYVTLLINVMVIINCDTL